MNSTLKYGSRSEEVKTLQRLLGITADGIYGKQTEAAVREYQRKNGLVADGIVGPKTWLLLLPAGEPTGTVANQPTGTVAQTGTGTGKDINIIDCHINTHITYTPGRAVKYIAIHYTAGSTSKTGTATVVVTKGGTTVAPVLDFAFSGLKQDVSGKQDKVAVINVVSGTTAILAQVNTYYNVAGTVTNLAITLPVITDATKVQSVVVAFTTDTTPTVTISTSDNTAVSYFDGYSIDASTEYELNIMFNGSKWVVAYGVIE